VGNNTCWSSIVFEHALVQSGPSFPRTGRLFLSALAITFGAVLAVAIPDCGTPLLIAGLAGGALLAVFLSFSLALLAVLPIATLTLDTIGFLTVLTLAIDLLTVLFVLLVGAIGTEARRHRGEYE